jgi:diguanylate cyclase (GGDEF)-like protein/PAS domain S-box-containing protein
MPDTSHRADRTRAFAAPAAAIVVGLLASVGSAAYLYRVQAHDTHERFARRSAETVHAVSDGLGDAGETLRAVRGLFDGSDEVTATEFARFVDTLDDNDPGLVSTTFVSPDGTVAYAVPPGSGDATAGATLGTVRAARERAAATGAAVASPPLDVDGGEPQFVVFLPVTRGGRLTGWVATTYRGPAFVAGRLAETGAVDVALYQGSDAGPRTLVGSSPGWASSSRGSGQRREVRIVLYDVPWVVDTVAPPGFTPASYVLAPWLLLAGGLLLTMLAAFVLRVLLTARHRAERLAATTTETLRANEERFRALAESSPSGVFFADASGELEYLNPRLAEIAGVVAASVEDPRDLLHPDDRPRVVAAWGRAVRDEATFRGTYRIRRPDGTVRWVDLAAGPTRGRDGAVSGWVGTANDVTDSVEAKRGTDRLTRILEHTTDLVTLTDPTGEVVWANEAARAMMRAVGVVPHGLSDLVAPSARTYFEEIVLPSLRQDGVWSGELLLLAGDGREVPVSQLIQAHYDPDGSVANYSFSARDLSERQDYQDRLAHEVLHDRLTGLANRALFVDRLHQSLARTARRESLLAVLFVDLDRFQLVNDSLGHEAGDCLLVEVAARLQGVLRSGDTAARFGGDEFTLLCEEVVDEAQATAIADRVLAVLSVPFLLDGSSLHLTGSVGIVLSDGANDVLPTDLLRDADAAMHRAKDLGKARYELFDERLRARAVARFQTESALHAAIAQGQLRVHYQPEVCLKTGRILGAEALVRWLHPDNGLVPPDEFIPLAEETGLIEQIGTWVLREACWQAARWRDAGGDAQPFEVWVNLSPRQLTPSLVAVVAGVLEDTGADPAQLGLEVTETALLGDAEAAIGILTELRALGVRIVIDDFGTGYSSLAYLRRLPVHGVKIDKSFVASLGTSREDAAIVAAVVGMASALGLRTIAEGVETRAQLDQVVRLGCDAAQGYYFAAPETRQSVDTLLAERPQWPGLVPSPRDVTELERARRRRGSTA